MSLFKCREWWQAPPFSGEEFDVGCLCVANIDNDPDGAAKVITGSLQGVLRVYSPKQREFQVDHQLLEMQLDQAVLQLAAGRFTFNHPGLTLAILHPRKVAVYSLSGAQGGSGGGSTHHELRKLYEYTLQHSAANMCHGTFGGSQGLDMLCVQSLDGQLSFYEGEAVAFSRFLPNFLLPGPITYVPETDCFVTANSSFTVECYKFSVLAASSAEKPDSSIGQGSGMAVGKKLQSDWSIVLGENVLDIKPVRMSVGLLPEQAEIVVLGEHNLYLVTGKGELRMQKRLDYPPASICCFRGGSKGQHNVMLGSSTSNVLVYRNSQLVWCAATDHVPVALAVEEFGGLKGLIVSLSDAGALSISYLGTTPPLNVVGGFEGKELDYVAMDAEHRQLLATIRQASGAVRKEPTDRIQLRAQVPTVLDSHSAQLDDGSAGASVTARVYASATAPLEATVTQNVVTNVSGKRRTPVIIPVTVTRRDGVMPASNVVNVSATYLKDGNNPRVATCKFEVPLVLLCTAIPPVKNAAFKITLDTNRLPPALNALFDDVLAMAPVAAEAVNGAGGNALSFQYYSGEIVTVVVSKNAGRYRLQSDRLEAMWVVADELSRRLAAYYQGPGAGAGGGTGPFAISFTDNLPLQDYWNIVDEHFEARKRVIAVRKELSRAAQELRSVQKRLLVRFKDKNPMPLGNMDTLLETTYSRISDLSSTWEEEQAALDAASAALSGATQLMLLLIRFRFSLDTEADEVLRSHLSPIVNDTVVMSSKGDHEFEYHGWEEMTEAGMTQLLRSCLARSAKESAAQVPPATQLTDTLKLKKHISLVLERLSKGGQLSL